MSHAKEQSADPVAMEWAMRISLIVGVGMLILKVGAWSLTHSAAILSDAAESVVHVVAVVFAYISLRMTLRPPDERHPYGLAKMSFFSAGFEGAMIVLAAIYIIYESVQKWMNGIQINHLGAGLLLTVGATLINALLGFWLIARGKKNHSIVLVANGKHVLTDSWTSLGVVGGLLLVFFTGWLPFDPICAILVALNILWTGFGLMREAWEGLVDAADPEVHAELKKTLEAECAKRKVIFHRLRHRGSGQLQYVEVHLLFEDHVLLQDAHRLATEIEAEIEAAVGGAVITTHLETVGDHEGVHAGTTSHV